MKNSTLSAIAIEKIEIGDLVVIEEGVNGFMVAKVKLSEVARRKMWENFYSQVPAPDIPHF